MKEEEGGRGEERRDEKGEEWRERKEVQERGQRQYIREVESRECRRIVKVHTYVQRWRRVCRMAKSKHKRGWG